MVQATSSASVVSQLQRLRIQRGRSLARVAKDSGVGLRELEAIERGRRRVGVGILNDIASALDTTLPRLLAMQREATGDAFGGKRPSTLDERLERIASAIAELPEDVGSKLDAVEAAVVRHAMLVCNGNQSAAARLLGVERKALIRRWQRVRADVRKRPKRPR